jgi:hypothetical protein
VTKYGSARKWARDLTQRQQEAAGVVFVARSPEDANAVS